MRNLLRYGLVMLASAACLNAAPTLRLSTTTVGPISIVPGTNGPQQFVGVANAGDGALNLTFPAPSAAWLSATYQQAQTCTLTSCGAIVITLATSTLPKGSYTGIVTVNDPDVTAINVPQTITVTVNIGGTVPDSLALYAPPGGSASTSFGAGAGAQGSVTTTTWLSVSSAGQGSFQFAIPWVVTANAATLPAGVYTDQLTVTGSTFAPDNKVVPVTFNVTTYPIADPGTTSLTVTASAPTGPNAVTYPLLWMGNLGQGSLAVGTPAVTVDTGAWLSVYDVIPEPAGVLIVLKVDPTGVAVGPHQGTVTVGGNADNGPIVYNVELDVVGSGPGPSITWPRILNVSNFTPGEELCPGDWAAVYGTDLYEGDPVFPTPPLTIIGTLPDNVEVLVNGIPAPMSYASYNQINIQIPFETAGSQAQIQVVRGGVSSAIGTVGLAARAPKILQFNCLYSNTCPAPWQTYGIGVNTGVNNAFTQFPIPTAFPIYNGTFPSAPASVGDVIVFYAVGLGQTVPPLVTGQPAPASPLPMVVPNFDVCFKDSANPFLDPVCTPAQYAGATPGSVGLYQINVQIPAGVPTGDDVLMFIRNDEASSLLDYVELAIQ